MSEDNVDSKGNSDAHGCSHRTVRRFFRYPDKKMPKFGVLEEGTPEFIYAVNLLLGYRQVVLHNEPR